MESGKKPLIIGAGISGLLVSKSLSDKKIPHVLLGTAKTNDDPVLGESMNEITSHELNLNFDSYRNCFHPKREISFQRNRFRFNLDSSVRTMERLYKSFDMYSEGLENKCELLHVDRVGFDAALARNVMDSEYCHHLPQFVESISYNKDKDCIDSVTTRSGEVFHPQFVFDASNNVRLLARALDIECEKPDAPRTVVFDHYYTENGEMLPDHIAGSQKWIHATNIITLDRNRNGISGVAWAIPLGHYISVGISITATDLPEVNPGHIMSLVAAAYREHGIDWNRFFTVPRKVTVVGSQHFRHKKFSGQGWCLVGGAALQAWFPSGSNIGVSLCAAKWAEDFLKDPVKTGAAYHRACVELYYIQSHYDKFFRLTDIQRIDLANIGAAIVAGAVRRFSAYTMGFPQSSSVVDQCHAILDGSRRFTTAFPIYFYEDNSMFSKAWI